MTVVIDSMIWLPPNLSRSFENDLKKRFEYKNPDYYKNLYLGLKVWGMSKKIKTYEYRTDKVYGKRLTIPRGGIDDLREVCDSHEITLKYMDRRTTSFEVNFPYYVVDPEHPDWVLRDYQKDAVETAIKKQQGVIRAPTGSGKTKAALALVFELSQRALIIMRDGNLLKQWLDHVYKCLGLCRRDVAIIGGGRKYHPGRVITLALQQTLNSKIDFYKEVFKKDRYGLVIVDETQTVGAKTYINVIKEIPCKYRIGFSADETRRDKKEFLIYDSMGKVIHETYRQDLEERNFIHPVTIRVIETDFKADWYLNADGLEKDFNSLLEEMIQDKKRNLIILNLMKKLLLSGEVPSVIFSGRREHVRSLVFEYMIPAGLDTGMLLGGESDAKRFEIDKNALDNQKLDVCVATYNSFGQGHDVPVIRSGVCATPISRRNRQFFGQVRGRICRTSRSSGKTEAFLYYLLDTLVFPNYIKELEKWNDNRVQVFWKGKWVSSRSVR
jgi:superfamily II DNA or RNA helicase